MKWLCGGVWGWLLAVLLAGCTLSAVQPAATPDRELVVFAAASLADAFERMGAAFAAGEPGVRVTLSVAGSQQLAQQLNSGAPADIFASANPLQMQAVVDGGRIAAGEVQLFANNRLVVVLPADNPAGIDSLQDLALPGLKLILADAAVPAGQYSLDFLAKASALPEYTAVYSPTVLANVVSYEDNVRAVLAKVQLGEADAGIVYVSDVVGAVRDSVRRLAIPDSLNVVASYPIAPVGDSLQPDLAARFVAFVLGPEGQAILADEGLLPVRLAE